MVHTYLITRSAFLPLTEAPLQSSQRFNSGILRVEFKEAPGMSSMLTVCLKEYVNTHWLYQHDPWTVNIAFLIIHYEIVPFRNNSRPKKAQHHKPYPVT